VTEALAAAGDEEPVIRSIVQLAHALNMEVVAQWVRRPDQVQRLRLLGCDMVQGNLYGEPVDAEAFAARATH
jgi:EAL domain-containing protein (putative c-di-GMP-specific phosphodiesterase class I)